MVEGRTNTTVTVALLYKTWSKCDQRMLLKLRQRQINKHRESNEYHFISYDANLSWESTLFICQML